MILLGIELHASLLRRPAGFCPIGLNNLIGIQHLPTASVFNSIVCLRLLTFRFPTEFLTATMHV